MKIVVGVVVERENKYLLVQEAKEKCRGKWNLPVGRWDEDESFFEGAIREAFEETGYKVELTGLVSIDQPKSTSGAVMIFAGKIIGGGIDKLRDGKVYPLEIVEGGKK